ncbi:hypothetical protein GCM10027299_07900 [Larkinella ripae]
MQFPEIDRFKRPVFVFILAAFVGGLCTGYRNPARLKDNGPYAAFLHPANGPRSRPEPTGDTVKSFARENEEIRRLVTHLRELAAREKNPLLKRHFESVATMSLDTTHGLTPTDANLKAATGTLEFFQNEGALWETYLTGTRPLIMAFTSKTDRKNSYYWLFLPNGFAPGKTGFPFYLELHGSGGGTNNPPWMMLYDYLQPQPAGATAQMSRREGFMIFPWGRGDKGYRDIAETDIFECLQDFDAQFKTDPRRQYLYGFSMGGGGTFRIARKSLNRWTAVGMYSAAVGKNVSFEEAAAFKSLPVWMVWGEKEWLNVENRKLKDDFLKAGVQLWWKEIEGVEHNYLGEYQTQLMDWFRSKRKK